MNISTMARRVHRSRLQPSPLHAALALAIGAAAPFGGVALAAHGAGQPFAAPPTANAPAASRFAPGDPRAAFVDAVLRRVPPPRPAAAVAVTNCDDAGPSSLREAVENAVSGDIVDLTGLGCSTITLTTGVLATSVDELTLLGPGPAALVVDAQYASPHLLHLGSGTLTVSGLTLVDGHKYATGAGEASGGCIFSSGSVQLDHAVASRCSVTTSGSGRARGGAIFAADVVLLSSAVNDSGALSQAAYAIGGGVYTQDFFAFYSVLAGNHASGAQPYLGYGGAVFATGEAFVLASTISGNTADVVAGADLVGHDASETLLVTNSTFAYNKAYDSTFGSALYVGRGATIANSTISGNLEANAANTKYGAALYGPPGTAIALQSSILSGNVLDTSSLALPSDIGSDVLIDGASNLIGYSASPVPTDTIVNFTPGLGPLADNGGPTPTMMPRPYSLAIDAGNDVAALACDQRGSGYPRVIGANADIGAVETDILFSDGFD
ncbi:MAG TPA: choice-of-anchor Q domain-containing protein [Dokdonella sp.]